MAVELLLEVLRFFWEHVDWKFAAEFAVVLVVVLVILWICFVYWRERRHNEKIVAEWRIPMRRLKLVITRSADLASQKKEMEKKTKDESVQVRNEEKGENPVISMRRTLTAYALIDGSLRAEYVPFRQNKHIAITAEIRDYLSELRRMKHENLVQFIGFQMNDGPGLMHVVHALIERGTLEEFYSSKRRVFTQEDGAKNEMEYIFKTSFMRDILKGLQFLHTSPIGCHGMLTAAQCLIDINWVLKLALHGVGNFVNEQRKMGRVESEAHTPFMSVQMYVCLPPECLKECHVTGNEVQQMIVGTAAGDIYCVGMIFFMMLENENPFALPYSSVATKPGPDFYRDIIENGRMPVSLKATKDEQHLLPLLEECWDRNPAMRPSIKTIEDTISLVYPYAHGNLADQLIRINERYADELEERVADKKMELESAQRTTMGLLNEMLPASIAAKLRVGITPPPRNYDSATVMFVQICDFGVLVKRIRPNEIIQFLNDVFDQFDTVIRKHDAYKVETTGETYMVASGVPHENDGRHVSEIADVSLDIRDMSYTYKLPWIRHYQLRVRIGFHAGPIAAGVIGIKSPRYCLFGDTVNFASRMQSNCPPNQIQTSELTARRLIPMNVYKLVKRGIVHVKGKGEVNCFWLNEHIHDDGDGGGDGVKRTL